MGVVVGFFRPSVRAVAVVFVVVLFVLVVLAGYRREEECSGLFALDEECRGLGAANFVRSLLTLPWLGNLLWVDLRDDEDEFVVFLFEISKTSLNVSKLRCNRVSRPHPNSSFKLSTVYLVLLPSWRRRGNRFSSSLSSSRACPFFRRLLRFPLALTFFWNRESSSGTDLSKTVFNLSCVKY